MELNEQNRIASENKKQRDIMTRLDKLAAMLQELSEQVASLQPKSKKKEDA